VSWDKPNSGYEDTMHFLQIGRGLAHYINAPHESCRVLVLRHLENTDDTHERIGVGEFLSGAVDGTSVDERDWTMKTATII
jgi:hypothetical protein